jgi:hypothetical protein
MGTLLDLLLIFLVLVAVLDGFRQGALRAALRLLANLAALVFAGIVLRLAIVAGFAREGWGLFLVYMVMFAFGSGVLDGLAGALHRRLRPPEPADPEAGESGFALGPINFRRAAANVYVATTPPERIGGLILGGLTAALTNGVFVLLLRVLPVAWITTAIGGSATAPAFIDLARSISFLLPPEIRP